METKGITRPLDQLGRVTIPMEYRRMYDMMDGEVEIIGTDDGLLMKAHNPGCVFCKSTEGIEEHEGQLICRYHLEFFKRLGKAR
jgi:transcriptional pleiotropic regulator of transition state genes